MTSDDYRAYFGSLFMLEENNNDKKYEFIMVLNARVRQGLPIYSYHFLKKILEKACGKKLSITYTHYPLPLTHDLSESKSYGNKIAVVLFLAIAYYYLVGHIFLVLMMYIFILEKIGLKQL